MKLHFLFICLIIRLTRSQKSSPCPTVFKYENEGSEIDRYTATIEIKPDKDTTGPVLLQILLDRPIDLLATWLGSVSSKDNTEFTIRIDNSTIKAGSVKPVKILVKYNPVQVIPSLSSIKFNGRTICPEKREMPPVNDSVTTRSDHNRPPFLENVNSKDEEFFKGDFYWLTEPAEVPEKRPSSLVHINAKPTCGVVLPKANELILNGYDTIPGQWPWHAALYRNQHLKLEYICGGTLVSERHVLTAAHCVTRLHSKQVNDPQIFLVSLGRHSLLKFGEHLQDRGVSNIFIHHEYEPHRKFNDIAVLKLSSPVHLTPYVQPCCLWEDDTSLTSVIGSLGTIVGWGVTEHRKLSENLMQTRMPIVSTEDCINSYVDFYAHFKHPNNFCAGYQNGTSVCLGDSGSGLVIPKKDSNSGHTIWHIRGVVSLSVALQSVERMCDTSHYALFTDVAKYTSWIQGILAS